MTTATTQIIISGKDQLSGVAADAGRRLGTELQAMQRGAAALSNVFAGLGAAIGGLGITQMAREVFQAGVAMDALQRSFVAVSGSQAMAAAELSFLREEAGRLGQSFYDLAPQYKQLAAAARGTSLEGEQARKIFSSVTAAAAALGLGAGETSGALNALAQMISKGNVQAEELRGQLGERLPGAFSLAAKAMGVSTQELNKMLDSGQVLAVDLLPKLAAELERVYGNAAQTAALESAQAAVNRMSEEWTNLKNNLFHSESAVVGIGMVTQALAGLNAMISNVQQGKVQWIWEGLQMEATDPSKYRGKVNRDMVMPAYAAPEVLQPSVKPLLRVGGSSASRASQEARAKDKMLDDAKKAQEAMEKWQNEYEERRIKAISETVSAREDANSKDLQLVTEFADKYKEIVLGETEFKKAQIEAQASAYRQAGADEAAVRQWVEAEKIKISRDWQDGATRALQSYVDYAGNAARNVEESMSAAFQGIEDTVVEFVKTGKLEFADLVTSINAEIARLAFRSMASEAYDWMGGLLKTGLSMAGSYFSGGASLSPSVAPSGAAGLYYSVGHHAGGIVGSEPTFMRAVHPAVFAGADRFHTGGIAGYEVPAILKRGEGVFTEGQMKAIGGGNAEMTALLRELVAATRAQRGTKIVNAIGKGAIANELSGSEGEQVVFNHIRRNPSAVRRMLGL